MKKGQVLLIGAGRCGNRLISKLKDIDKRYTNLLFVNSSLNDMITLPHYNEDNAFIFGNDGSGKDKEKSKKYVSENINGIADTLLRYGNIKDVFIFASADGGSGSTFSIAIANLIKKLTPDKYIHMITVLPDPGKVDRISLQNSIETWNQVISLYENKVIQTIRIIDNSAYNSYEQINEIAMRDFDASFNLIGSSANSEETIDVMDQTRILRANGYILTLQLNERYNNVKAELESGFKNSAYAIPENFNCDFLGLNVPDINYIQSIRDSLEVFEATYSCISNKQNGIVVMSGMDIPQEIISFLNIELEEKQNRSRNRVKNTGVKISLEKPRNNSTVSNNAVEKVIQPVVNYSAQELDSLLEDITLDLF